MAIHGNLQQLLERIMQQRGALHGLPVAEAAAAGGHASPQMAQLWMQRHPFAVQHGMIPGWVSAQLAQAPPPGAVSGPATPAVPGDVSLGFRAPQPGSAPDGSGPDTPVPGGHPPHVLGPPVGGPPPPPTAPDASGLPTPTPVYGHPPVPLGPPVNGPGPGGFGVGPDRPLPPGYLPQHGNLGQYISQPDNPQLAHGNLGQYMGQGVHPLQAAAHRALLGFS